MKLIIGSIPSEMDKGKRAMELNNNLIEKYRAAGLLTFASVFNEREIAALLDELEHLLKLDIPYHLKADSGEFLGTTVMNKTSSLYDRLLRDERLVKPAEKLLGGPVYAHQYKVILKEPFGALSLPWHQDYGPWHHHDGMLKPDALSFGIFLDEVTEYNGPIVYIPGSHRDGLLDYEVSEVPGTTPIPSLSNELVTSLVNRGGLVSPKGNPGSVTLFHCCTAHASGNNVSPYPRRLIYVSYNRLDNAITKPTRAEHFAAREFETITAQSNNLLLDA
ncbi:MAG: phytanoyl-CoA dioxygenase family protein [Gammaproteobacteria bacterium]